MTRSASLLLHLDHHHGGARRRNGPRRRGPFLSLPFSRAITLAVATVPGLYFAYRRPPVHITLETAASLIALLAANNKVAFAAP